jgi:spore germination protein GerM
MALAIGLALLLGACGQAVASPDSNPGTVSTTTVTGPAVTTTTVAPDPTTTVTDPIVPSDTNGSVEVMVYLLGGPAPDADAFTCSAVVPVIRNVEPPTLLTGAIEALLAGPTDEEQSAGYRSWFSTETGWTVASVTISDGVARIDFSEDSPRIPNASTSCGSIGLRAQLDATATQFPTVDRAVYSIGGDIAAFYHWLEADVPEV